MNILIWLVLGAVAGWIAGLLMKGAGFGLIGNIVVGIVGSFLGGYLAGFFGIAGAEASGFNLPSILTAVLGACVLLFIISLLKRNRT